MGSPRPALRGSGPAVARAFHALLGLNVFVAFWSLAEQLDVLIGSRGLLPFADLAERVRARDDIGWLDLPTLFVLDASDATLHAAAAAGMVLGVLGALRILPRLCWALAIPLYLSFCIACRDFLSFQWDNMLLEVLLLACFLPRDRRARVVHFLFRCLVFKLYFESGMAKWQSYLLDWHDGSAMTWYYETAPIPTWLGWHLHHMPEWWHHLESWFAIAFELVVAPMVFGPRALRLLALAVFTGFQVLDIATANYGFFCYLSLALHVFLLDDRDLHRARRALGRLVPSGPEGDLRTGPHRALDALRTGRRRLRALRRLAWVRLARLTRSHRWRPLLSGVVVVTFGAVWLTLSVRVAVQHFTRPAAHCAETYPRRCLERTDTLQSFVEATEPLAAPVDALRLVHAYHLFGHITRERIEPEVQTFDGATWTAQHLRYKPGPPHRPPPVVAPHQPRVDFRLWFYGLGFRRGMPRYVATLQERLCDDPDAVQGLFAKTLPAAPQQVRIAMWRYRFSDPRTKRRTGDWWTREYLGALRPRACTP